MNFYDFPYIIGNVIIPTDEVRFFRGVGQPPTSFFLAETSISLGSTAIHHGFPGAAAPSRPAASADPRHAWGVGSEAVLLSDAAGGLGAGAGCGGDGMG